MFHVFNVVSDHTARCVGFWCEQVRRGVCLIGRLCGMSGRRTMVKSVLSSVSLLVMLRRQSDDGTRGS